MVVNRSDIKRKRKEDSCFSLLDESPKRTKVHAQRKFAQGSNVSSPVITPVKEIERQDRNKDVLPEPVDLLPMKRPNTEDFLTFLCFRGTPILPPNLNFFNAASIEDSQLKSSEPKTTYPNNGPILTATSANKSPNEKPFVAFGVRKRADPVVISKQMDRKRRHALALQALRRKYQEQKMAKIRAVTISKLSEKGPGKTIVRTRSVTKSEITCKKPTVAHKTNVKVITATKRIATKTSIKQPIKSKMCLRSFRGRYIHKELNARKHKKRPRVPPRAVKVCPPKKTKADKSSSEFSSDDDEPLIKTKADKKNRSNNPVKKQRQAIEPVVRLTRSNNNKVINKVQTQRSKQTLQHRRIITRLSSTGVVKNKIVKSASVIRSVRRTVNTVTVRKRSQRVTEALRSTRQRVARGDVGRICYNNSRKTNNSRKSKIDAKTVQKGSTCKKEALPEPSKSKPDRKQIEKKPLTLKEPKVLVSKCDKKVLMKSDVNPKVTKKINCAKEVVKAGKESNQNSNIPTNQKKTPVPFDNKKQKPSSSSSSESADEEQKSSVKVTDKRKSTPKTANEMVNSAGRPSRKTKEAAAIYMELLGHKLVNANQVDDDDESIDSFPELPNVRKTEQRENELKAKATKSKNADHKDDTVKNRKEPEAVKKDVSKVKAAQTQSSVNNNSPPKVAKEGLKKDDNKIVVDEQQKDAVEKKEAVGVPEKEKAKTEVELLSAKEEELPNRKRKNEPSKIPVGVTRQRSVTEKDIDNAMAFMFPRNHLGSYNGADLENRREPTPNPANEANISVKPTNADQSFSDSDEEPLSNLTKSKDKTAESCEENKTNNTALVVMAAAIPADKSSKRGATSLKKKPHNYLPFSSSDDEEKYFHGFVKTEELKTSNVTAAEGGETTEKCPQHSLPSSDLSCKDVSRRYGKGKVNMSNEQIEKWLNDSAMAGMNIKKEEEDILKLIYEEEKMTEKKLAQISIATVKAADKEFKEVESSSLNSSLTPEKSGGEEQRRESSGGATSSTPKSTPTERKTIFRKEKTEPVRNVNAFSANNECSVYAFEADNEDSSVSTPFRRPCRRPSSTATSRSEDEAKAVAEDVSKFPGKFRYPTAVKVATATPNTPKPDDNLDGQTDTSNSEPPSTTAEDTESTTRSSSHHKYVSPKYPGKPVGANAPQSRPCPKTSKIVTRTMFPPSNAPHKAGKLLQNSNKSTLESFEDSKYKVPNSPGTTSSSSSAKLAGGKQRAVAKNRGNRFNSESAACAPVTVTEFPSCQATARIVEAPTFRPTEKEFQDPLEYIEKIRGAAEQFGICRIVPPANFKPECKVSDDMRFTAYNQYVHKMLHRWGPNFKELMAIRKYLRTQNITLTHPPWIGGMEIDLPRLYQTVQSLGGLKEVIEKKKWPKVSEAMKIPKSAQDRVTKLDDIYCKYLLPYDTLSPAEREKLFDEVETDWAKRESKTLLKVQRLNKLDSSSGTDADSDSDNESEECIAKGRNIALNAFYRIARNTMSMWFRTSEPSAEEVELEFWKHVTLKNHHICVHSGSIDSGSWGYGFAVSKNSPFARHAWNLKVLTNNSGSVLRSMGPVMGVTVPTLHVGMVFSACCWYRDPHRLPWIEYLHTGARKIWYGIPDSMSERFHAAILRLAPNYCRDKSIWLPSDTVMVPPKLLVENGVSLCRTVQEPGQFVVVFPQAFTSSVGTGYAVSESVYFAPAHWLKAARLVFDELRENCEPSMFSVDRLLLSITSDARSNVEVLGLVVPAIRELCAREKRLRDRLRQLGLGQTEKLPPPEVPAARKRRKLQRHENAGDYECEICRANLFISLVTEYQEDVIYCLEHVIEYIEQRRVDVKNCKLLYTYECEELDELLDKVKSTIETKQQKKIVGKAGLSLVK